MWLQLPGEAEWKSYDSDGFWRAVNDLGAEGWELVGPPTVANAVFTYKAATGVFHDKANWVEMTYWFKRRRSA